MIYNPFWLESPLKIPADRKSLNALYRELYFTQPIVYETINYQSFHPLNFLKIEKCEDPKIDWFFKNQVNKIELERLVTDILFNVWLLGDACTYGILDEDEKAWEKFVMQNPDYLVIQKQITHTESPVVFLRPDERLRSLVLKENHSEEEKQKLSTIDEFIIETIRNGQNIKLDKLYTEYFSIKYEPYDVRGTSILRPALKDIIWLEIYRYDNHLPEEQKRLEDKIKKTIGHPDSFHNSAVREITGTKIKHFMDGSIVPWLINKVFTPIAKINNFCHIPPVSFDGEGFLKSLQL